MTVIVQDDFLTPGAWAACGSHTARRFHELIVCFFSRRELGTPLVVGAQLLTDVDQFLFTGQAIPLRFRTAFL